MLVRVVCSVLMLCSGLSVIPAAGKPDFVLTFIGEMGRKSAESGLKVHPLAPDETVEKPLEDEDPRQIAQADTEEDVCD